MINKKKYKEALNTTFRNGAISRSSCPQQKANPINISFDGLSQESGITLESYFSATLSVMIRIDKEAVEKYIDKQLTIKDLNDMINCRK